MTRAPTEVFQSTCISAGARRTAQVSAQILDARGAAIGKPFGASVAPNQQTVRLETKIAAPKLWTAETPHLYRVRLTLAQQSNPRHTVTERFGFRTFEVRPGDGLYLNGQRIILKGTNRHSFWPESGRTTSRKISYEDVRLLKEMNNNAVRMSHYPPDEHFLEACDELGLYVLDELGGWQRSYDTETGRRLIGEMIRRDVNHPSILFWDNGNEGGWNKENDDEFAKWDVQKRPVLHPWELFRGVNTDHYENYESHARLAAGPDIYMPTEFLHALYDGGAGAGLWDYWELLRKSKVGAGGFIWALLDECVARTDMGGRLDCSGNQGADGIVGPHREKEGSFYTVREIWSPVQVAGAGELPDDFRGVLALENRYDFTNLDECSFEWELARFPSPNEVKAGHVALASGTLKGPNVPPHGAGELKLNLPATWRRADALYLTAKDPAGRELWTWSWGLKRAGTAARRAARAGAGSVRTREEGGVLVAQAGTLELRFDKQTGLLAEVRRRGKLIPFGNGPRFVAFRRDDRKYMDMAGQSAKMFFEAHMEGGDLVVEMHYNGALKRGPLARLSRRRSAARLRVHVRRRGGLARRRVRRRRKSDAWHPLARQGAVPRLAEPDARHAPRRVGEQVQRHDARRELGLSGVQGLLRRLALGRLRHGRRQGHGHQRIGRVIPRRLQAEGRARRAARFPGDGPRLPRRDPGDAEQESLDLGTRAAVETEAGRGDTTIESGPIRCSTRVWRKPASRIHADSPRPCSRTRPASR